MHIVNFIYTVLNDKQKEWSLHDVHILQSFWIAFSSVTCVYNVTFNVAFTVSWGKPEIPSFNCTKRLVALNYTYCMAPFDYIVDVFLSLRRGAFTRCTTKKVNLKAAATAVTNGFDLESHKWQPLCIHTFKYHLDGLA